MRTLALMRTALWLRPRFSITSACLSLTGSPVGGGEVLASIRERATMESYTVRLEKGKITYLPSTYACDYCGWSDTDKSFFYLTPKGLFCSLHKEEN